MLDGKCFLSHPSLIVVFLCVWRSANHIRNVQGRKCQRFPCFARSIM